MPDAARAAPMEVDNPMTQEVAEDAGAAASELPEASMANLPAIAAAAEASLRWNDASRATFASTIVQQVHRQQVARTPHPC
jgi:hypothetical protein